MVTPVARGRYYPRSSPFHQVGPQYGVPPVDTSGDFWPTVLANAYGTTPMAQAIANPDVLSRLLQAAPAPINPLPWLGFAQEQGFNEPEPIYRARTIPSAIGTVGGRVAGGFARGVASTGLGMANQVAGVGRAVGRAATNTPANRMLAAAPGLGASFAAALPQRPATRPSFDNAYGMRADPNMYRAFLGGGGPVLHNGQAPQGRAAAMPIIDRVMRGEGGYVANDNGRGPTNFGINQHANPDVDVRHLTPDRARQIYHDRYWVPSGADRINDPRLAELHFDTAVNMGVGTARDMLAQSGGDINRYMAIRAQRYTQLNGPQDVWQRRLADLSSRLGLPPPPGMEAYDQRLGMAMGQLDQAQAAAMQPFSTTVDVAPPPEIPDPQHLQAPDFSAGDAAFAASRPQNPFERESEHKILRRGFFNGIAQAMLGIQPGRPVGFGELLLRAGAGGLAGRGQGAEEVERRQERYDGLMQQYNQALAARQDQHAVALSNTINRNIEMDNEYGLARANRGYQEYLRRNPLPQVDSSAGTVTFSHASADGRQQSIEVVPIPSVVARTFALQRASLLAQSAGPAQSNSQWGYGQATAQALALGGAMAEQGGQGSGAAIIGTMAQVYTSMAEDGTLPQVIGPDNYNQLAAEFDSTHPVDPMASSTVASQRAEQQRQYIVARLTRDSINHPELWARISSQPIAAASMAGTRARNTRTTTRQTRQGPMTTTSYDMGD